MIAVMRLLRFAIIAASAWVGVSVASQDTAPQEGITELPRIAFENVDFHFKLLLIGGGTPGAVAREISEALRDLVNDSTRESKMRSVVIETPGYVFNVMAVANGAVQVALTQADNYQEIVTRYRDARDQLRLVTRMGTTAITVFVKPEINGLADLKGRVFNVGPAGTASAQSSLRVLEAAEVPMAQLARVEYLSQGEAVQAFCSGRIDASVFVTLHPSPAISRILACGGKLLTLPADVKERLQKSIVKSQGYTISNGTYPSSTGDIETVGVPLYLMSTREVDPEAIYRLVRLMSVRYPELKARAPYLAPRPASLADLRLLGVPLHEGTERAFSTPAAASPGYQALHPSTANTKP